MEFEKPKKIKIQAARNKEELAIDVGARILAARTRKGLKQVELAKLIGSTQPALARIENGKSLASLEFVLRVAKALDGGVLPPNFDFLAKVESKVIIQVHTVTTERFYTLYPNRFTINSLFDHK